MTEFLQKARALRPLFLSACALIVGTGLAPGQIPEAAKVTACSSPIAAMLPECQTGSTAGEEAPVVVPSTSRTPVSGAEATADTSVEPGRRRPERASQPEPRTSNAQQTEFQRLTESVLGESLPIFGESLFADVPTTFAPVDRVPVPADYTTGPGDELLIRVWGQVSLNVALTVDRAGEIYLPQVGSVRVAGLPYSKLTSFLRSNLERVYRNFDLNVTMGQLRSIQIYVVGSAKRPGGYTVSSLSTLVNAIFACGGPSREGSMRRIQLRRGPELMAEFDLYDLLLRGDKSRDKSLMPGDVVHFSPAGKQVALAGSIRRPAIYEIQPGANLDQLIELAGGIAVTGETNSIVVERIRESAGRQTQRLSLSGDGGQFLLRDGDIVRVPTLSPRISNSITLRGNVGNPGRFAYRPGLRLRDVIPDKESLVTRNYWNKKNAVGFVAHQDTIATAPAREKAQSAERNDLRVEVPEINWSYAVIERQNSTDLRTELVVFSPSSLLLHNDDSHNHTLQPGDVITFFSHSDIRVPISQQNRFVRLEGEFKAAGMYNVGPGETLRTLLSRAGGLTPQAYLFGAEFTREAARAEQQRRLNDFVEELDREIDNASTMHLSGATNPQESMEVSTRLASERKLAENLKHVRATGRIILQLNPTATDLGAILDLPLEDGDRLFVPARPATVHVFGAVYNPNTFLHAADQTIARYLQHAGGVTRYADEGRMFVIRADGTVIPRRGKGKRDFKELKLEPGDALVAPGHVLRTSRHKAVREWAQVFAQFALGTAAINVLR